MIIVTLVSTLAAAMVWQQWRAVQVEVAERGRMQSAWILSGALAWAQLILREDAKSGRPTALTEPWATPLAEARLSTFLAADKENTDDAPEAFLSGSIVDAQSRYNLRNLVGGDFKVNPAEVQALVTLLQAVGAEPGLAQRIANGLQQAIAPAAGTGGDAKVPLMPQSVSQLGWLGIDAESIERITPYVVLLPIQTPVNINTAAPEVLLAAITGLDRGTAERLVQVRQRTPFKAPADAAPHVPEPLHAALAQEARLTTRSSFFEIRGRLRLSDRVLEEVSLVQRQGLKIVPLSRQREASREFTG